MEGDCLISISEKNQKMIEFVCERILPYFLKERINRNKSGI
jgi:hypothetical protein